MVPWLRPRRMRDVSVVMIAEALMRAISAHTSFTSLLASRLSASLEIRRAG